MIDFLKKIWAWIISIPQDKLLHYNAIDLVASFSFAIFFLFLAYWPAFGWANLVAAVFAIGKEVYDAFHPDGHSVEWKDLVADFAGLLKVDLFLVVVYLGMII